MNSPQNLPTQFFYELTPGRVLDAVESFGGRCTGRVLALNSLENRVYEVELDIDADPDNRWDSYRVVKFYRPGRWSRDQIVEEHRFLLQCEENELPVVAPLRFPDGETVQQLPNLPIYFALFKKVGGRILDEMSDDQLRQVGRTIARVHTVGAREEFQHRLHLGPATLGEASLTYLESANALPKSIGQHYSALTRRILSASLPWFAEVKNQRIHGDCHIGNILWSRDLFNIVDFDDSYVGPPVQDLWLLTPGRDEDSLRRRETLISGYEQMRSFNHDSIRLIEPLRAIRMVHFSAWISKRIADPAFKRIFVDYGTESYWREQLIAMQEVGETLGIG